MSYPQPVEPIRRPAAVTAAAAIMVLMALLGVAGAATTLVVVDRVAGDFRAAAGGAQPAQVQDIADFLGTYSVVAAVLGFAAALLLAGLAVGNLRGSTGARIATWVLCGLGLAVGCCGVFGVLLSGVVQLDEATTADPAVAAALRGAFPGWWLGVNAAVSGGQALGYIAVAALLALPAAGAWFRRTPPSPPIPPQHYPPAPPVSTIPPDAWRPPAPATPQAAPPAR